MGKHFNYFQDPSRVKIPRQTLFSRKKRELDKERLQRRLQEHYDPLQQQRPILDEPLNPEQTHEEQLTQQDISLIETNVTNENWQEEINNQSTPDETISLKPRFDLSDNEQQQLGITGI